jgi:hypothetical protein
MIDNAVQLLQQYMKNDLPYHMDLIRADNPAAFTRNSAITLSDLFLQMLSRKNLTQFSEVMAYYESMNKPMPATEKAFFMARRKINPEAVRVMSNEFIANVYDNYDDSIIRWKDLVVLGIDGSKCRVPNTRENRTRFGKAVGNSDNQPAMVLLSTLHDSINNLKLDVLVDRVTGNEQSMASSHIEHYCDNYIQPALFIFDRGYVSIRLIDQIFGRGQFFLIRANSTDYRNYFDQVEVGEDKEIEMKFERKNTNHYRNDVKFRTRLLNTTYKVRFAKIVIGTDDEGNENVEYLMTNLPKEKVTTEELKEAYWIRWPVEVSYNRLKNRMSLEEFSGYKPELILQDIYADIWMYNLVSLKIKEADEKRPVEQKNGNYTVSRNFNKSVGVMKTYLLKALTAEDDHERERLTKLIDDTISSSLNWVKNEKRTFERKKPVNKSAIAYKKSY